MQATREGLGWAARGYSAVAIVPFKTKTLPPRRAGPACYCPDIDNVARL